MMMTASWLKLQGIRESLCYKPLVDASQLQDAFLCLMILKMAPKYICFHNIWLCNTHIRANELSKHSNLLRLITDRSFGLVRQLYPNIDTDIRTQGRTSHSDLIDGSQPQLFSEVVSVKNHVFASHQT